MSDDSSIVHEVRQRRMEMSKQLGHDPRRFFEYLRGQQERYRHRLVSQITVVAPAGNDVSAKRDGELKE